MQELFAQLTIASLGALLLGQLSNYIKQPVLIGYILLGTIISQIRGHEPLNQIEEFAHVGIMFLLFMVGIHMNPKALLAQGIKGRIIALTQVVLTALIGMGLIYGVGLDFTTSMILGLATSFSSTIIVLKTLSDNELMNTVFGKSARIMLITQDVFATIFLLMIPFIFGGSDSTNIHISTVLINITIFFITTALISIFALPKFLWSIAKNQEFLLLFGIGRCIGMAYLGEYFHLGKEVGALLAGVALSPSTFKYELIGKIKPLRDFFIIIFFIGLGTKISPEILNTHRQLISVLTITGVIIKPLIVYLSMNFLHYTSKNSLLSGLFVGQLSEFSIIFVTAVIASGVLDPSMESVITTTTILTIAISIYYMKYGKNIYHLCKNFLHKREFKGKHFDEHNKSKHDKKYDLIVIGFDKIAYGLIEGLPSIFKDILIVDFNPEKIKLIHSKGFDFMYGDVSDQDFIDQLPIKSSHIIISTLRDEEINAGIISTCKDMNEKIIPIVVAHTTDAAMVLYNLGADYVILPHYIGAYHTTAMLQEFKFDEKKYLEEKMKHILSLSQNK